MLSILSNKYVLATIILAAVFTLSIFLNKILLWIKHLSSKTKTQLDDILIRHISLPLKIIFLVGGFYYALRVVHPSFVIFNLPLDRIFNVIWILTGALFTTKIIHALFLWYTDELQHKFKKKIDSTIFNFVRKVINAIIVIVAILLILMSFGVKITPLLAGLGIGGIAIALALKPTLENFFSAIYLSTDRPIRIGDFIELDDKVSGHVTDIGWRTTRIKTWDNNHLIIPNSKISSAVLRNYNAPRSSMLFAIPIGVSYDADLEKVEKVVIDVSKKVLKRVDGGDPEFKPVVRYTDFGDSSINFNAILKVKDRSAKFPVRHEFIKAIHERFKKERIEIPFPQRDVHTRR